VVRDGKGRLAAVFQWFPFERREAFDRVAVSFSPDEGKNWSAPQPITVAGLPASYQRPYDPTLVLLGDGRLRLYFTSQARGERGATHSAVSRDGVHYTFEPGARFQDPERAVVDASVARLGETWHLFAPGTAPGRACHATSTDGLRFSRQADIVLPKSESWIGNPLVDGGLRFYGSGRSGWSAFSRDGTNWKCEPAGHRGGGDPAVVRLRDGGYLMISTGPPRPGARRAVGPPVQVGPRRDSLSATGEFVYVLRGGRLYQLDAKTLRIIRSVDVSPGRF
jgi:hypothetical protein